MGWHWHTAANESSRTCAWPYGDSDFRMGWVEGGLVVEKVEDRLRFTPTIAERKLHNFPK